MDDVLPDLGDEARDSFVVFPLSTVTLPYVAVRTKLPIRPRPSFVPQTFEIDANHTIVMQGVAPARHRYRPL